MKNILLLLVVFFSIYLLHADDYYEEKSKQESHMKYNEVEMEISEFITMREFDEWLKVNDYYDSFVKAYNSSLTHPYVKKVKCLYALEMIQGEDSQMSHDEMQMKCSSQI